MKKFVLAAAFLLFTFVSFSQNTAIDFDGANDYVEIPDNNAIDLSASFTLEAWIFPTGTGSGGAQGGMILNKENSYEIARFGDGSIQFALSANGAGAWAWANTNLIAPLNQWSHVAMIKNGTAITVYLNASSSYSDNAQPATMTGNASTLRIGGRGTGSQYFDGYIEEVRIWNSARIQADVKKYIYNKNLSLSASGLVAYYRMNEGSGATAANASANTTGIDGTLTNGPLWVASPIQFSGNALNFDGSDDVAVIPQVVSSNFTIEYWMRTSAIGSSGAQWYNGNGIVDAEVGGQTNDWGTALAASKLAFGIGQSGFDVTIFSTSNVNTGNWVHVAATWQQSTGAMQLYINGALEASGTGSTNLRNAPPRITFGQLQTNIQFFNGSIDEVRIWNVVRTQTQIQDNWNNELDPATQANLAAYYGFNQGIAAGANTGMVTLIDQKGNNNGTMSNFSLSGASSNFILQKSDLFVLPVEWNSFTVQNQDRDVLLNWSTASEQNTKDFIVQHSINNLDWNDVASTPAAGNSAGIRYYSYLHTDPAEGINFYRIQQRDIDNRRSYSDVRTITLAVALSSFTVIQNPVADNILEIQVHRPVLLSLYDTYGRLLYSRQVNAGKQMMDVSRYAKGIYVLQAKGQQVKVMIQ